MKRRHFIQASAMTTTGILMQIDKIMAAMPEFTMPKRRLGKTGEEVTTLAFGGITLRNNGQNFANEVISRAYDLGCRYYDIAPSYGDSQELLGPALVNYRKNSFLACKTMERSAEGARKEMEESLRMLKTDHLDLYQLHAITTKEDVEKAFAPDGAMETILKAKDAGKIKHIGFSAHSTEAAMLAMDKFEFDTILFPINYACWYNGDFGPSVYERAKARDMGVLAIKAFAVRRLKEGEDLHFPNMWYRGIENEELAEKAFRFTMSKGISAAVPSGDASYFWKAAEYMNRFENITSEEDNILRKVAMKHDPVFSNHA